MTLFCFSFVSVSPSVPRLSLVIDLTFILLSACNKSQKPLMEGFFSYFFSLLILMNRIPKEDLELQCREVETTHTLKTGKRQLSFLMCSRVDPLMACSSKCPCFPLQSLLALQVGTRQGVTLAVCLLTYVYITSEVFKRELGSQLIHYVLTVTKLWGPSTHGGRGKSGGGALLPPQEGSGND